MGVPRGQIGVDLLMEAGDRISGPRRVGSICGDDDAHKPPPRELSYDVNSISIPSRVVVGDFAGWLRDSMAARGLSTRGLAARSGIDHSTIYRLAKGSREPSLNTAVALLRVLGTEPLHSRLAETPLEATSYGSHDRHVTGRVLG
jgi:ribosome-binding protein aMBF1 (putative translation factor)